MFNDRIEFDVVNDDCVLKVYFQDWLGNLQEVISYDDGLPSYKVENEMLFVRQLDFITRPGDPCSVEWRYITHSNCIREETINVARGSLMFPDEYIH